MSSPEDTIKKKITKFIQKKPWLYLRIDTKHVVEPPITKTYSSTNNTCADYTNKTDNKKLQQSKKDVFNHYNHKNPQKSNIFNHRRNRLNNTGNTD
jgi:hypothetical protein